MIQQEYSNFFCTFATMKAKSILFFLIILALFSCHQEYEHKTIICIPVYGQSLALGEEAIRITNFDSLAEYADGRIVTENLDHNFGYFDNNDFKEFAKKITHYQKRSFELTIYSMAEILADSLGTDTLICIFPGGQGATAIKDLSKGTIPYQKFLENIENAYNTAREREWDFFVPAICWMQGESDIEDYPGTDYKILLKKFQTDINNDIKSITHQTNDAKIICYQTNNVSGGNKFNQNNYNCIEAQVPQSQLELVRDDSSFWASGPTYPYDFVRERIHIDGTSHQLHGQLVALTALDIIREKNLQRGLLPEEISYKDKEIIIKYHVPSPPLILDTLHVTPPTHYGFSVITPDNKDIAKSVSIQNDCVYIQCSEQPNGCRVRYAINGEQHKSGRKHGPRGNLRDSQGEHQKAYINGKNYPLHNWCWQFDISLE